MPRAINAGEQVRTDSEDIGTLAQMLALASEYIDEQDDGDAAEAGLVATMQGVQKTIVGLLAHEASEDEPTDEGEDEGRSLDLNAGTQERALGAIDATTGRTLSGYAVRWNEPTIVGGAFVERFAPGSWDDSIRAGNIKVVYDHGRDAAIGLKPIAGQLAVTDDGIGAAYRSELLDAPYVADLMPGLRAGLYGASFRFNVPAGGQTVNKRPGKSASNPDGLPEVTITRANIVELGPTTFPAYAGSTSTVRSINGPHDAAPQPPQKERGTMPTSIEDLISEVSGHRSRLSEIDAEYQDRSMTGDAKAEFDSLAESIETKTALIDELRSRTARVKALAGDPANVEHERSAAPEFQVRRSGVARGDDIYDLSSIRSSAMDPDVAAREFRERALRSIESTHLLGGDESRSQVEALVNGMPGEVGRHLLATGSPQYRSAFRKTVMGQPLNGDEIRAMGLTGANGGFAQIPYQLDPTIIRTGALAINPIREIARSVQIAGTNTWKGVSSGAVTAQFAAEAAVVTDGSPTYAQPSITCFKADAFVPFSYELGEDYPNLLDDLGGLIAEAKMVLEANKFTLGSGTGEPKGIVTAATTTVAASGVASFAVGDVYALDNAVPARYQINSSIIANRAILNLVRRFDTTNGATLFGSTANLSQALGNGTRMNVAINGYPAYQVTDMVAALTTGNKIAIQGDFNQYVIVDRIGMAVEVVPNLFDPATGRPTGQRGLMCHWRVGADVTNAAAFRTLVTG